MSLPAPNLDDRKFQEIVDEVKRQIGYRCPEWTEHNVSDPGVTLLELFAYMTELTLFRLNQVPEKNYIRFLELLGIGLETPGPAQTDIRFMLTRAVRDTKEGEDHEITLPARETVVATLRTESEEAIEFSVDSDLRMVQPKLAYALAVADQGDLDTFAGARSLSIGKELKKDDAFSIFSKVPSQGDALYLGFEGDIGMNVVSVDVDCLSAAASGLNESYPSQVYECYLPASQSWERLEIIEDETRGFNRTGSVLLAMPKALTQHALGGRRACWIRCRYTLDSVDLPPRGIDQLRPSEYQRSPELTQISAKTVGGTAPASNCTTISGEILGISDGLPGQVFALRHSPVLRLREDEVVTVGPDVVDEHNIDSVTYWKQVPDFAGSNEGDRHFVIDYLTGEIQFGPSVAQPEGGGRQHGAVPGKGMTVRMSHYRTGGGVIGNVRENKLRVLKRAVAYVGEVTNPKPAIGGRDRETLERAKLRAKEVLQIRNRAVTAEDFEFLAAKAATGVGRAKCLQPVFHPAPNESELRPGVVRVLLVPSISPDLAIPKPSDLKIDERIRVQVFAYLNERRLLTTQLEVAEPDYKFVSVHLKLVPDPRMDPDQVRDRVIAALNKFINPLYGGQEGTGWGFRRTLTLADIYAQVGAVRGVAFLLDAKISVSKVVNYAEGSLSPEEPVSNAEGVRLLDGEMVATRQHSIQVVPMSLVGATDLADSEEN